MEIFHHDIGLGSQLKEKLTAAQGLEIQRDAFLVGIEMQEQATLFRVWLMIGKWSQLAARITAAGSSI